ncbi:MAG: alpha-E domain-containing protein [Armatimonadetes bacterium]|nr:alpha-E domain-containing protein [Armatimonadota bacterium]MBS1703185.1 alpha-E domain-containing protein [Armatimonadota bacterium]
MLSRHADSAYWLGRYMERAEATARMIDVHYHFGLESRYVGEVLRWSSILAISGNDDEFHDRYSELNERNILYFFAFDPKNFSSVSSCLNSARENARAIRDQISSEMWECANRVFLDYKSWNVDKVLKRSPNAFFQMVKESSHLFQGIADRTLMTGETKDFFQCGRFLERADQTARILDVKYHDLLPRFSAETVAIDETGFRDPLSVGGPIDTHGWAAVLKSVGAFEAFRKTSTRAFTPEAVAQFLILNPDFPASVRYSMRQVDKNIRRISGNNSVAPTNRAEREIGRLYNDLNYMNGEDIVAQGLHEFLEGLQERCNRIGDAIYSTYLSF